MSLVDRSPWKFLAKIGFELEGAWLEARKRTLRLSGDGSVDFRASEIENSEVHIGELASTPFTSLAETVQALWFSYPDFVNKSCGFHIHISTKNSLFYSRLMDKDFYTFWKERMQLWAKAAGAEFDKDGLTKKDLELFTYRFEGKNHFCEDKFIPEQQTPHTSKGGPRYTQLNYCFNSHGTLECRLHPMYRNRLVATSALVAHADAIEDYLSRFSQRRLYKEVVVADILTEDSQVEVSEKEIIVCA